MNHAEGQNDEILAAVAALSVHDVSARRARRLHARCHDALQATQRRDAPARARSGALPRIIGPALAGAWCLAYLVEILRRAAAVYGL